MIDGLVSGKLYGKPTERVGASGKPFVNVIAFDDGSKSVLLALDDSLLLCERT